MDGRCSASVGEEVWQGEVEAAALARPSRLASTAAGGWSFWSWVEFVGTTKRKHRLSADPFHPATPSRSGLTVFRSLLPRPE